ncbi:hypothetical protein [Paenibacillus sonchi]|uniref:hypothetical protein n=1 Tax=Paenibacillus sonchi TaxID=373687 RepID=UPI001F39BE7E|nr:hypothetical protein [Paenibacillus sonchi]
MSGKTGCPLRRISASGDSLFAASGGPGRGPQGGRRGQQRHFCRCFTPGGPGGANNGISAVVSSLTARNGTYNGIFAVVSRPAARDGVNNGIFAVVSRPTARDGANNGTFAVVSRPAARGGANNGISAVVPRPAACRRRRHPFCPATA